MNAAARNIRISISVTILSVCFLSEYNVAMNSLTNALIQKYRFVFAPIPWDHCFVMR